MTQKEYDDEEEMSNRLKNDLSLFNELSRENYDITELDDGADLTGKALSFNDLTKIWVSFTTFNSFIFQFIF